MPKWLFLFRTNQHFYSKQGRRQGKSLRVAKEPRGPGGSAPGGGPGAEPLGVRGESWSFFSAKIVTEALLEREFPR